MKKYTVEQFYKDQNYPKYDRFDKKAEKFTYYDLTEFAENYHHRKIEKLGMSDVAKSVCYAFGWCKIKTKKGNCRKNCTHYTAK